MFTTNNIKIYRNTYKAEQKMCIQGKTQAYDLLLYHVKNIMCFKNGNVAAHH